MSKLTFVIMSQKGNGVLVEWRISGDADNKVYHTDSWESAGQFVCALCNDEYFRGLPHGK